MVDVQVKLGKNIQRRSNVLYREREREGGGEREGRNITQNFTSKLLLFQTLLLIAIEELAKIARFFIFFYSRKKI